MAQQGQQEALPKIPIMEVSGAPSAIISPLLQHTMAPGPLIIRMPLMALLMVLALSAAAVEPSTCGRGSQADSKGAWLSSGPDAADLGCCLGCWSANSS